MYIAIFEDGAIRKCSEISDEDLDAVDAGVMELIDIRDQQNPRAYYGGDWCEIDWFNEE